MQRNIFKDSHTGAWIVEFRYPGDCSWTRVYNGDDEKEARIKYCQLGRQSGGLENF